MSESFRSTDMLAYVPALHRGYLDFFDEYPEADIGVLDQDVLEPFPHLRKDINALDPGQAVELLGNYYSERFVRSIGRKGLEAVMADEETLIVMPNDEVSSVLLDNYPESRERVRLKPIFLRWDRKNTMETDELTGVETISASELPVAVIEVLEQESSQAANMWRRVGAVIFAGNEILSSAHNESKPTSYTQTIEGDPRNALHRGVGIEYSNDYHAEAKIIARSAKLGHPLEGLSMAVTTFPCPVCAKDIAEAGISNLYFAEGYAVLDGRTVLESADVRLVKVDGLQESREGPEWRGYPPR